MAASATRSKMKRIWENDLMKVVNGMMCLALAGSMAMAGCASTAPMNYTRLAPSASGEVEFKKGAGPNGNNLVTLEVAHMPPAERLSGDLTTYVVWMRPKGTQSFSNAGALELDEDRTGQAVMTTPFDAVEVVVTAEKKAMAGAPSANVVLKGSYPEGGGSSNGS
jgi:hypothetical protein